MNASEDIRSGDKVKIALLGMTERIVKYVLHPNGRSDCFYVGIEFRGHTIEYHNAYVYPVSKHKHP